MFASPYIQEYRIQSAQTHGLSLPTVHSSLQRKNFIYRMLFKDIY